MSRKSIGMKKIKEVLRLKFCSKLSDRVASNSCKIGRTTVQDYQKRAKIAGFSSWEQIKDIAEDELEKLLFPISTKQAKPQSWPDWIKIYIERKKPGVTLQLLWEEYLDELPEGLGYSRFCELFNENTRCLNLTMRQNHKFGDKLFVDYSGKKFEVVNSNTGEICTAELFVAVLGASNYTYAEATWTQQLPDWIGSHVRTLEFIDGVPACIVPDNLKSGVTKAWYYDPEINPSYADFANHYQTAILPARARKPRDKAKVENAVLIVQRWILACLRNHRFFSLKELNVAIITLLIKLNDRPFKKLPGSRKSMFEELEKVTLKVLPATAYEYAEWKKATVNIDYHVEFGLHYYSAPHQLARQKIDVRATATTIEIFKDSKRVASHVRSRLTGKHSTISEHMPANHQACAWNPDRLINWASKLGGHVALIVESIMDSREHPEQGYRASLGIIRLESKVGKDRLDAACKRALFYCSPHYRTVVTILKNSQEFKPLPEAQEEKQLPTHNNIRGAEYFRPKKEQGDKNAITTNA